MVVFSGKIERVERSKMLYIHIYHRGVKRSDRRSDSINQTDSCETRAVLLASKINRREFLKFFSVFCKSLKKLLRTSTVKSKNQQYRATRITKYFGLVFSSQG